MSRRALRAIVPHLNKDAVIATQHVIAIDHETRRRRRPAAAARWACTCSIPRRCMPLVEVIAGAEVGCEVSIRRATLIAESWGKTVVRAADVPGFIVNRVARPYYLEGFRILEEAFASVDEIDKAMSDLGGFRMGPLELTDLIGQDINAATTHSVWEQLGKPSRLVPSKMQISLVKEGRLGLKTTARRVSPRHRPAEVLDRDHAQAVADGKQRQQIGHGGE